MTSLQKNIFYNTLVKTFRKRYLDAMNKCHTIIVPINDSYECNVINDHFISAHILKDSPLLKSHFVAANNKHTFDVEIDEQILRVTRGFGDKNCEIIQILSEEIAYNYQNKDYRILICEKPLIKSNKRQSSYESTKTNSQNVSLISFADCESFLRKLSPQLTDSLKAKVEEMMKTYIILPKYLNDAKDRFKVIIDWGIENFESLPNLPEMATNDSQLDSAIESYIIGLTDPKLLDAINKCYKNEDELLYNKFTQMSERHINPVEFGSQQVFESFTINAIIREELSRIESKVTPLEKLYSLRKTLDLVTEQMNKSVQERHFPLVAKSEPICIMSDDLIAAVICVLTAVQPKRFESEINFIQTFSWNLPQNNEFGYSLVTFEVVKEFIKNYNLSQNSHQMNAKSELKGRQSGDNGSLSPNYSYISSPLDRELEKISKMIDISSIGSNSSQSRHSGHEVNDDLGEFLGSLSQNSFSVGFGKQF